MPSTSGASQDWLPSASALILQRKPRILGDWTSSRWVSSQMGTRRGPVTPGKPAYRWNAQQTRARTGREPGTRHRQGEHSAYYYRRSRAGDRPPLVLDPFHAPLERPAISRGITGRGPIRFRIQFGDVALSCSCHHLMYLPQRPVTMGPNEPVRVTRTRHRERPQRSYAPVSSGPNVNLVTRVASSFSVGGLRRRDRTKGLSGVWMLTAVAEGTTTRNRSSERTSEPPDNQLARTSHF